MKKSAYKIILRLFSIFFIFILLFIGISFFLLYNGTESGSNYINWSSSPIAVTQTFAEKINFNDNKPQLSASAITELEKYKLCLLIVDKNGDVSTSYNSPAGLLHHYSPIEIVEMYKNTNNIYNYTMFVGGISHNNEKWTYIIGFPVKISKITLYMNHDTVSKLIFVILGILFLSTLIVVFYQIRMNAILSNIITYIRHLASDSYTNVNKSGMFRDVYKSLNFLNTRLKTADIERKRNDTMREEWIADISHDLKSPLSPITGYAEILAASEYPVTNGDIQKYGIIILKNAKTIETIVENLNFTYQLKNGIMPINRSTGNLARLLKETVINILNRPEYETRNISFSCNKEKIDFDFDNLFLQRAFNNLILNAVIHNPPNTDIKVSINEDDKIYIQIEDTGKGIDAEELRRLFERYYRSANTNVRGSGLGMAISRQIIEIHEGKIHAKSILNLGTIINIEFPKKI